MDFRRTARLAGILYLITHVTSVAAVILYGTLLTDPEWVSSGQSATMPKLGALADFILGVAVLGTGVVLHSLIRHASERGATAYAALRTLEASAILMGAALLVAAVSVPESDIAAQLSYGIVGIYHWVFLIGMGLVVGVHTTVLALVLRRHNLIARWITTLGIVGAILVTVSNLAVMFGIHDQVSATAAVAAIPIFAWEISLAVHLIWKGLRVPTFD